MTVSAKTRYALEIMTDLAEHRAAPVSVSSIAERRGISEKYAEQIMTILKRAGFVLSERGAYGGYRLAGSPENYRVGDILRLMEGGITFVPDTGSAADKVWARVKEAVERVVDGCSIADLMKDAEEE